MKGYAVSALMKIYAFEIASGRKVDVLPEVCIFRRSWSEKPNL